MGTYRKRLQGEAGYVSFVPVPIGSLEVDTSSLEGLIKETEVALGRLDAAVSTMTEEEVSEVILKEAGDSCSCLLYTSPSPRD